MGLLPWITLKIKLFGFEEAWIELPGDIPSGTFLSYDMITIWYDMIWYDMIWYDMIWYDMIWYDMIWYDMIFHRMYGSIIWYHVKNICAYVYIYVHINHIIWKAMFWPCMSWNVVTCRDVVRHDWETRHELYVQNHQSLPCISFPRRSQNKITEEMPCMVSLHIW